MELLRPTWDPTSKVSAFTSLSSLAVPPLHTFHTPPPPRHGPTTWSGVTLPLFAPLIAPDCPSRSCIQIMALCPRHSDYFSFPPTDQSHCCLCILSSFFMKLSYLHTADCFSTFRFQFNCLLARGALTDHTQSHSKFILFSW